MQCSGEFIRRESALRLKPRLQQHLDDELSPADCAGLPWYNVSSDDSGALTRFIHVISSLARNLLFSA